MQHTKLLVALLVVSTCFASCRSISQRQEDAERAFLRSSALHNGNIPQAVRLAFHDCVGGCDACVNFNHGANNGLQNIVQDLNDAYAKRGLNNTVLSRADYFVLAGIVAVELAAERQCRRKNKSCTKPMPTITFKTGRVSCNPRAPLPQGRSFGNPHGDLTQLLTFFRDRFRFSVRNTVAIMGAHTLGAAHRAVSGWDGKWVRSSLILNNQYYKDMLKTRVGWTQRNIAAPGRSARFQWTRSTFMMLNTDMCLIKDLSAVEADGSVQCTYQSCRDARSLPIVQEYAADNAKWMSAFSVAFQKMIDVGQNNLRLVTST